MIANQRDQLTERLPLPHANGDLTVMDPDLAWRELTYDEKAHFLLVAMRTMNHKPLPDPKWRSLETKGLAKVMDGSLILSAVGVFLMQHVVGVELAWLMDWI